MKLTETGVNAKIMIQAITGSDLHLINRLTSIGLTQGTQLQVIKNDKKMPVLIFARETLMALNRKDAERIEVNQI